MKTQTFSTIYLTAALTGASLLTGLTPAQAQGGPLVLDDWLQESYAAAPGSEGPFWQRTGTLATQLGNTPSPTFLHSPFDVSQHRIVAELSVDTAADNDWIGFAIGFDSGETRRADIDPEYLYIDWKKSTDQDGETSAPAGLAISRVFGIPSAADFANHVNTTLSGPENGLEEIARGRQLGSTGWQENRIYRFEFEIRPNGLRVWVDGALEFDLVGPVEAGRFACMSFSQERTRCGQIVINPLPDGPAFDLGDDIPTREGEVVRVPVHLDTLGNSLRRLRFGVDYDEACLSFDPVDADDLALPGRDVVAEVEGGAVGQRIDHD
ncbi:MAG: hypothetical protein AAFY88_16560, partial [Acidobacteriota bacterium]